VRRPERQIGPSAHVLASVVLAVVASLGCPPRLAQPVAFVGLRVSPSLSSILEAGQ